MTESAAFGPFNAAVGQLLDLVREVMREELIASRERSRSSGWMNLKTAADYLDMEVEALRSAVRRGKLPVHRGLSGRWMLDRAELDEAVREGLSPAPTGDLGDPLC